VRHAGLQRSARLAVAPLLLGGVPGVRSAWPEPAPETSERCDAGQEPRPRRPLQGLRVFMDNRTVPHPARSGFHYPRFDARLHHGDEVQFESPYHNWLSLTDDPAFTLLGKSFDLEQIATRRFCGLAPGHLAGTVSCNQDGQPGKRRFEVVTAGNNIAIQTGLGNFCSDRPGAVVCSAKSVGQWETFEFVDAGGGGRVRLRGLRGRKFCGDTGRGLICDQPTEQSAAVFRLVADTELRPVPVLTRDHAQAATFVVHREDLDSPMLALFCKSEGRYLAAEEGKTHLSCSSTAPWYMASARVHFRHVPGMPKWDLSSVTLRATSSGHFLSPGNSWNVQGQALFGSREEVKWKAFLTGGCETFRPLIRGVNLGNWFVIEKWMAAYLFQNESGQPLQDECKTQDEYGLMSMLGPEEGRRRMEEHWSTWITEDDIAWMASHGINAIRVPFGYWMVFPMPPFVPGQLKYLERLFHWCEKYSLSILLDFHGLKGSQTGSPTSGNCGGCGKSQCGETWLDFLDEQKLNLEVIRRLVVRFSHSPAYLGFAVANEVSHTVDKQELMSFYQRAYDIIRYQNRDALVVLYGTFAPSLYPWDNFQQASVDIHIYFGWGFGSPTVDQQVNLIRARNAVAQVHWPVLVGEWSLAANGHPTLHWEPHRRDAFFHNFARMQLQAWETHSTGWFYWSYKTRFHNSTWNYRDMCEVGWLPGCTESLKFGPLEWWKTPACAYAYMDGQCEEELNVGNELERAGGLVLPLFITSAATVAIFTAGILVVRRYWRGAASRGFSDVLEKLPWASLPELPPMQLSSWDVEREPMMKPAVKTPFSS